MEAPSQLPGICFSLGLTLNHSLRTKDVSVGRAIPTWFLDVFLSWSDISVEEDEDLHGG